MRVSTALVAALLALGAALVLNVNGYYVFVLANVALLALVGIGLNVLLGLTGQMSFGHVGFYAIGAYTVAILTGKPAMSFWLAWPIAMLVSGVLGALLALPALRVKGPYLAMITIAFGFIVEHSIVEMRELTGGQNGIMSIKAPSLAGVAKGESAMALIALATVGVALAAFARLSRGTWGAAMRAVRDSEVAAESIGLNPLVIKTVAFAISATCAGAAGALFAPLSGFVTPQTFGFGQSILFVLVVMIGGSGSIAGPLMGAMVVGLLPEFLAGLEDYRLLFFGLLLLVVLWLAPEGMAGLWDRWQARHRRGRVNVAGLESVAALNGVAPISARAHAELQAADLSLAFGGLKAVDTLSLRAPAKSVTSLIGPNGAGKTTALNVLSGFYRPDSGGFSLGGQSLHGQTSLRIARAGVARTYQTSQLFGTLSVLENVALALRRGRLGTLFGTAALRAPDVTERAARLLRWCGYAGLLETPASQLPHVDRRLVEIARALAMDPDVILLDEPAAGLSREDKAGLARLMRLIADSGIAVLLVEHDMGIVMQISDQVIVLDAGKRLATGTPAEIQANPAVRLAYLGESLAQGPKEGGADGRRAVRREIGSELLGVGSLVAGYGAEPVLQGVSLQVRQGEAVALLGANGAGKSTLMRSLAGLHRPVQGGIHLDGQELTHLDAEQVVARGMVLVPEGRQVFGELSVLDNIRLGAFLQPAGLADRIEQMLTRFPRLRERLNHRAGLLSGGEQQMLALARALISRPRLLLLDEPSLGLAPKIIEELFDALELLRAEGMTLLLVDQMSGLALALADRAYVMEGGQVIASGTAAEIARNGALARAYLGEQESLVHPSSLEGQ